MPLARYFLYVGGVLLTLLFVSDAVLPKLPVADRADTDLPVIRIHSDRKWPARVVFDTNLPTIAAPMAKAEASIPAPLPPAVAEISAKARVREAFAQLPFDPKKPEAKPRPQKRRIARSRVAPPVMLVAQQPRFGFFDNGPWNNTW
jgi:hypothetical protein